jgi:hypothetical protein
MNRPDSYWDYVTLFEKYKNDCTIFFESGTHHGESVLDALYLGFEKIISVEILPDLYKECSDKFKDNANVHLFFGDSEVQMPEMLKLVDRKSLFWLDGHFGHGVPTWKELEFLESHPIKNHTIIIDDIYSYFDNQVEDLKNAIRKINPDYTFVMEHHVKCLKANSGTDGIKNGHLVAFI